MAVPVLSLVSTTLFSLLLLCSYGGMVHGEEGHGLRVFIVDSLMPAAVCYPSKALGRNTLKVVHRHGPCSPSGGGKPDHLQLLAQDALRVASLQSRLASGAGGGKATQLQGSEVSLPARRGISLGVYNYVVTLGFGTPKKDQTVAFDTGSDLSWIQCRPCVVSCYQQQEPIFDPSASTTYRDVSCGTAACRNLPIRGCSGGTCLYRVDYLDNSTTEGFLAEETLTLTATDVFPGFLFGCGESNRGIFGRTAGLVGLGRSPYSLVSQTAGRLGNVFSYCLPATSSGSGHLTLGKSSVSSAVYTPMLADLSEPSYYFVDLVGISVGGARLSVPPTVFRRAGTIIDSGTVVTRLPPLAYSALRSAFRSAMWQYPLAPPFSILDTCYDFSNAGSTVWYPLITLHYDGADVTLKAPGVFFPLDVSRMCLAFATAGPGKRGFIGNVQQSTFEVIYDVGAKRIGFATGACS